MQRDKGGEFGQQLTFHDLQEKNASALRITRSWNIRPTVVIIGTNNIQKTRPTAVIFPKSCTGTIVIVIRDKKPKVVVIDVRAIDSPTVAEVICMALSNVPPFSRSSLYRATK